MVYEILKSQDFLDDFRKEKIMIRVLFAITLPLLAISSARSVLLCETDTCKQDADQLKIIPGTLGTQSYNYGGTTWAWSNTGVGAGTVSGISRCSASNLSPTGKNAGYCWCRVTNINGNSCGGPWVFHFNIGYGNAAACETNCAVCCEICVVYSTYDSCTRAQLFTF